MAALNEAIQESVTFALVIEAGGVCGESPFAARLCGSLLPEVDARIQLGRNDEEYEQQGTLMLTSID